MMQLFFVFLMAIASILPAAAVDDPGEMLRNPAQERRAERIGAQLRCLVCQNESIEDSSAPLARDLRRVVRAHVAAGESNAQIIGWMTQRYGDFIRLRPRLTLATALLWGMPVLAPCLGVALALSVFRRRATTVPELTEDERARLAHLREPGS